MSRYFSSFLLVYLVLSPYQKQIENHGLPCPKVVPKQITSQSNCLRKKDGKREGNHKNPVKREHRGTYLGKNWKITWSWESKTGSEDAFGELYSARQMKK